MDYDDFLCKKFNNSRVEAENNKEALKLVKKIKGFKIAVNCPYDVVRFLVKKNLINCIYPKMPNKDYFNQKLSGLDEPLLKECAKKKIAILFKYDDINLKNKEKMSLKIGKLSQNAFLCMKFKVPYFICSGKVKKDKYILTSFGNMLGLNGKKGIKFYPKNLIGEINND